MTLQELPLKQTVYCACGRTHNIVTERIEVCRGAIAQLPRWIMMDGLPQDILVIDDVDTHAAAGAAVVEALTEACMAVRVTTLPHGTIADKASLGQIVLDCDPKPGMLVAVGTGAPITYSSRQEEPAPIIGDGYIQLPTGEILTYTRKDTVRATAYTHTDAGCDMITSTGTTVHKGTVAVDPRYIPYGTRMFIVSNDGEVVYGLAVAEDCGGDIKGDRMDLYYPTFHECMEFGRRVCTIYFLG